MAVLPIVKYGDPLLRKKAERVIDVQTVPGLLDDMFETMYEEAGMGLAANQVGLDMNFAIIDISHEDEGEFPHIIINPEILESSGSDDLEEGCLSIPEIRATISRPEEVLVEYQDPTGETHREQFNGLLARVIQHEVDHLNGVFYIDHLTPVKRAMINKRLAEIAETGAPSTGITL
ncbi:MAG: peptide deformylase [Fidelibacterota bacterium]|nr:MAG: peptide deformylase [Candidatus Neomarinimicrobiota bacterium]